MSKEWEDKCLVGMPDLLRMILIFFWNQCLEAGRFLSSTNRGSRGEVFFIPSGEEKVLWTDKVRWGWQIENED